MGCGEPWAQGYGWAWVYGWIGILDYGEPWVCVVPMETRSRAPPAMPALACALRAWSDSHRFVKLQKRFFDGFDLFSQKSE